MNLVISIFHWLPSSPISSFQTLNLPTQTYRNTTEPLPDAMANNAFSFPTTIELEFGVSLAPDSAAADRIFLNGKLMPHEFQIHPSLPLKRIDNWSSSKESLHSWRSSSIGSSSARSDNSLLQQTICVSGNGSQRRRRSRSLSSRQWQFIAPMPTLTLEHTEAVSWRRTKNGDSEEKGPTRKKGYCDLLCRRACNAMH